MKKGKDLLKNQRLQAGQQRFEFWRQHKKYRGERIPKRLWSAAAKLTKDFSVNQVSKALGISCKDFRRRLTIPKNNKTSNKKSPEFIEITQPQPMILPSNTSNKIELETDTGWKIRFSGSNFDTLTHSVQKILVKYL